MKTLAVLMTVHNRRDSTLRCLDLLYSQEIPNEVKLFVYLTDDGCTDGTPQVVKERYPDVFVVQGDGTLFWNMGMRKAWEEAAKTEYDYYLWLNDDTFLYGDSIKRVISTSLDNNDSALLVGSTCSPDDNTRITYGGWVGNSLIADTSKSYRCDTINGNVVLVPKSVFDILGFNTTIFKHRGGDTDYGIRANEKGIPVLTVPGVIGECARHDSIPIWKDPSQPLSRRWKNFFSPLGANPFEFFRFRKLHYGIFPAIKTFITNFFHVLFPSLWEAKRKN